MKNEIIKELTPLEIIEETVKYYHEDGNPRGVNSNGDDCFYLGESGQMCAVGRCMTETALQLFGTFLGDYGNILSNKFNPQLHFKPQYRGNISETFWSDLQMFHDDQANWSEGCLTKIGEQELKALKQVYKT